MSRKFSCSVKTEFEGGSFSTVSYETEDAAKAAYEIQLEKMLTGTHGIKMVTFKSSETTIYRTAP